VVLPEAQPPFSETVEGDRGWRGSVVGTHRRFLGPDLWKSMLNWANRSSKRITQIYEGTNQIQRVVIAKRVLA
jgi:alkylation response protein AidB-like acyl-CoA dehydrogenase